jgi:hypothetical protein
MVRRRVTLQRFSAPVLLRFVINLSRRKCNNSGRDVPVFAHDSAGEQRLERLPVAILWTRLAAID